MHYMSKDNQYFSLIILITTNALASAVGY